MRLTGQHFIAGQRVAESSETFSVINSTTSEAIPEAFYEATFAEVDAAMQAADEAYDALQTASGEAIAKLIEDIADGLEAVGQPLLDRVQREAGYGTSRNQAERGRAQKQARIFAQMARDESWRQPRINPGSPQSKPPIPDVRTMLHGVGPVVVFGASNFPLAISVAGTDTVSALAARCPVVVKAHPAHPGTCEIIGEVIRQAVQGSGLPAGTFSMLQGTSHEISRALVQHAAVAAVAFTGSLQGGRALFDAVNQRPQPVPFYAEMGSTNPVFLLPGAMSQRVPEIAKAYVQSVNMGVGQFCTNPGVVLGIEGPTLDQFIDEVQQEVAQVPPATMLHPGIHESYWTGQARFQSTPGMERVAQATTEVDPLAHQAACQIYAGDIEILQKTPELMHEVFGPSSLIFKCQRKEQLLEFAKNLNGHLTATLHGTEKDLQDHQDLVRILFRKVGRIVFNGFPTGIEICEAMHHGGPYPATTHSYFTSIGQHSIYRFTKPVCLQGFPVGCLPERLKNES